MKSKIYFETNELELAEYIGEYLELEGHENEVHHHNNNRPRRRTVEFVQRNDIGSNELFELGITIGRSYEKSIANEPSKYMLSALIAERVQGAWKLTEGYNANPAGVVFPNITDAQRMNNDKVPIMFNNIPVRHIIRFGMIVENIIENF